MTAGAINQTAAVLRDRLQRIAGIAHQHRRLAVRPAHGFDGDAAVAAFKVSKGCGRQNEGLRGKFASFLNCKGNVAKRNKYNSYKVEITS